MAGIYNIGSKLGYDLANGLQVGQSVTATDGSVWTKNADGSIGVLHNGEQLVGNITYQPQPTMQQQVAGMPGGSGYQSTYGDDLQAVIGGLQNAAPYESMYAEDLKNLIGKMQNSKWEGYDKETDPSYQAYRKEYLREADRSMEDTLGAYAQNTGGIAGSQAITAASQAADYYKSQLNDKIPELYENAYNRYLNEVLNQQNLAGVMMNAESMNHNQYMSELANQQNLAGILMNAESQAQSAYYNQINYALSKWAQMGYADQEVAGILGVTAGTPTSDQSYTDWATAFEETQYNNEMAAAAAQAAAKANKQSRGDPDEYTVKGLSRDGNSVTVYGTNNGLVSWTRLEDLVNQGRVKERVSGNTVTYEWVEG